MGPIAHAYSPEGPWGGRGREGSSGADWSVAASQKGHLSGSPGDEREVHSFPKEGSAGWASQRPAQTSPTVESPSLISPERASKAYRAVFVQIEHIENHVGWAGAVSGGLCFLNVQIPGPQPPRC